MRKLFGAGAAGLLMTAGLVLGTGVAAHADSTCSVGGPAGAYSDSSGNSGVQVCVTSGPAAGTITAAGNPASFSNPQTAQGYLIADGSSGNSGALSGYIGVSSGDDGGVVGCSNGDYSTAESAEPTSDPTATDPENNTILGIPPTQAQIAALAANTGSCATALP